MDPDLPEYDYRNCTSLFGYAATVHARSGGVCQLCGAGADRVDFDWWRQLTVEHLVGEKQGGYRRSIESALSEHLPHIAPRELAELVRRIDEANTVSACSFCNSTTSRDLAPKSMAELIAGAAAGATAELFEHVTDGFSAILDGKRRKVAWKLQSVRKAFDASIARQLLEGRRGMSRLEPSTTPNAWNKIL